MGKQFVGRVMGTSDQTNECWVRWVNNEGLVTSNVADGADLTNHSRGATAAPSQEARWNRLAPHWHTDPEQAKKNRESILAQQPTGGYSLPTVGDSPQPIDVDQAVANEKAQKGTDLMKEWRKRRKQEQQDPRDTRNPRSGSIKEAVGRPDKLWFVGKPPKGVAKQQTPEAPADANEKTRPVLERLRNKQRQIEQRADSSANYDLPDQWPLLGKKTHDLKVGDIVDWMPANGERKSGDPRLTTTRIDEEGNTVKSIPMAPKDQRAIGIKEPEVGSGQSLRDRPRLSQRRAYGIIRGVDNDSNEIWADWVEGDGKVYSSTEDAVRCRPVRGQELTEWHSTKPDIMRLLLNPPMRDKKEEKAPGEAPRSFGAGGGGGRGRKETDGFGNLLAPTKTPDPVPCKSCRMLKHPDVINPETGVCKDCEA